MQDRKMTDQGKSQGVENTVLEFGGPENAKLNDIKTRIATT